MKVTVEKWGDRDFQPWFEEQLNECMVGVLGLHDAFERLQKLAECTNADQYTIKGCETVFLANLKIMMRRISKLDKMLRVYPERSYSLEDIISLRALVESGFDYRVMVQPEPPVFHVCPECECMECAESDCSGCGFKEGATRRTKNINPHINEPRNNADLTNSEPCGILRLGG